MKIEHTSFSWYMKRFIFLSLNTIYKTLLAICTGWYDSVWQNKLLVVQCFEYMYSRVYCSQWLHWHCSYANASIVSCFHSKASIKALWHHQSILLQIKTRDQVLRAMLSNSNAWNIVKLDTIKLWVFDFFYKMIRIILNGQQVI